MYLPTHFEEQRPEVLRQLIDRHPLGLLITQGGGGLCADPVPFLFDPDSGPHGTLRAHVARANPVWREARHADTLVVFQGPQGYVSPGWYDVSPAVPTWDFAVAHLHGIPEILSDDENLQVLDQLVAWFEGPLPEPFLMHRTLENTAYAERIVHGTVGFRLRVDRFEAKDKMSQDKPAEVIAKIVEALRRPGPYENPTLADRIASTNGLEVTA